MTGSQNLHEDNHLEFSGPPVLDLPTFITTSTGLRSGQAPRPPKRTHSVSSLPSPVFDYTPLMQHLKSNPDARLVPYEPAVAAKVVEQQISVTEGQSLGGLAGIPSEGESITILDSRETLASARTVRFAAVREAEERIPSFSNSTSTASLSAQEPQSILKAGAGPSPIDIAALQNSYSDSGSEGLSDYDEDTEEGSVSDESSADEEPDSASETQGHNGRNGDLREISSRRKFRNRGTSEDEPELQSEIEITDDPTEDDSAAPPVRDGTVTASDIGVRLENATLADYEDMDGLLNTLDKYIKKNRHSRSLAPPTMNNPLAGLKAIKTKAAPSWAMEAADTASAQSEKKPDAQTIHATLQRSQIDVPREINGRDVQDQAEILLAKLTEANVKKITTRIYIEDARSFKTLQLTSLMSADQIINDVVTRFHLEQSPNWTLFELCNDLGIERPIRDWEIVTDVISAWDISTSINAIVMKKYGYRDTVSPRAIAGKYPRVQGWMYMEVKPGKWQRKFFVLRESNLYYYKDAKQSGVESLFCGVGNYDVYTLSQRRKKTPTQFCFALRSTDSITFFENKKDYVRYLCVEKQERLYDWVLAIRLAKSEKTFADFPELFEDYEEISEKARQRVIRHMEPPSPVLAKPPTREKIELKRVDMVDVRREDPRRTTSSPEPIARRTTDVRRHTEPPKRTRTQRRSRESPSETDDEPLFVRQMRQNPQPKADEGQEVSDGLNRGSTRLKRGSNTERARDGDPSAARRDMEREKARGENSRRRKARASAEMEVCNSFVAVAEAHGA